MHQFGGYCELDDAECLVYRIGVQGNLVSAGKVLHVDRHLPGKTASDPLKCPLQGPKRRWLRRSGRPGAAAGRDRSRWVRLRRQTNARDQPEDRNAQWEESFPAHDLASLIARKQKIEAGEL